MDLRAYVAEYLKSELDFFKPFITDPEGVQHYLNQLRTNGVWADDLEIQVVSEMYDCKIEIFTTSSNPVKIFNENPSAIRSSMALFYLQKSHYDVIMKPNYHFPLGGHQFGLHEQNAIDCSKEKKGLVNSPGDEEKPNRTASRIGFEKLSKLRSKKSEGEPGGSLKQLVADSGSGL